MAHALVTLAGLLLVLYPLTVGAHPRVTCRGVQLHAGQSCAKADHSGVQTYEQRLHTANQAKPVLVGVGLFVAVFGAVLLVSDGQRRRRLGETLIEDRGPVR